MYQNGARKWKLEWWRSRCDTLNNIACVTDALQRVLSITSLQTGGSYATAHNTRSRIPPPFVQVQTMTITCERAHAASPLTIAVHSIPCPLFIPRVISIINSNETKLWWYRLCSRTTQEWALRLEWQLSRALTAYWRAPIRGFRLRQIQHNTGSSVPRLSSKKCVCNQCYDYAPKTK